MSITAWCGITNEHIIRPHLLHGSLSGLKYATILTDPIPAFSEECQTDIHHSVLNQNNDCPFYYSCAPREAVRMLYLDTGWVKWTCFLATSVGRFDVPRFLMGLFDVSVPPTMPDARQRIVAGFRAILKCVPRRVHSSMIGDFKDAMCALQPLTKF
jgi:hypothetical protein